MNIRRATEADLPAITDIYNEAVVNTTVTFDTTPKTLAEQKWWLEQHTSRYPALVAEVEGKVVGWAALSPWSDRPAYAESAEGSLYIHKDYRRKGIGRKLFRATLNEGKKARLHTVIGRIAEGNEPSLKLLASMGFTLVGTMCEVGFKFGRRLDVHIVQLMLDDLPSSGPNGLDKSPHEA